MSTDRELLELAAKAAGLESMHFDPGVGLYPAGMFGPWNPLTDDGDALRLAVKLSMNMALVGGGPFSLAACGFDDAGTPAAEVVEPHEADPCAATRRAIVRAAAAIGKSHG